MNEGKCKKCGAKIIWIKTIAGKNMPCNPEPIKYWEKLGAKWKIVTPNGEVLSCEYEGDPEKATGMGYTPHFGNCTEKQKGKRK